jgi:hypothetical protein
MASTWTVIVNGEKYPVPDDDVKRLRADVVNAVRSGGDWVTLPVKGRAETVEVLMTPATQVALLLQRPPQPPMAFSV